MALAERKGATIACLQGTLFDGVSEWVNHGYRFFSLNRSGPRQKDGCMTAISTTFARTQIRCGSDVCTTGCLVDFLASG